MTRALLCWELGGGIGYTEWLVGIARALRAKGLRPVLALRDIEACRMLLAEEPYPILPAPQIRGHFVPRDGQTAFTPTSFADLMACNGFASLEQLAATVRAWQGIIDVVRPHVIVGAYCPALGLAALDRVPLALIGYAYTLPPADGERFPVFNRGAPPYADQDRLLSLVQQVQRMRGALVPRHLTEIYRGDARFVLTFPELDPYGQARREPAVGPLEDLGDLRPLPPEPRFHAYLVGGKPFVPKVIEGLLACGLPGSIYVRDLQMVPPADLASRGIEWLTAPPPLAEAVTRASVVVHHGGANTLHWALGAGRPQIIVPRIMDQTLSAAAAQRLGVSLTLRRDTAPEDIGAAVRRVASDETMRATARRYAEGIRRRRLHSSLAQVVEGCLDLIS